VLKAATEKTRRQTGVKSGSFSQSALLVVSALLALVLATTIVLTLYNNNKLDDILEESVKSELLAVCFAARADIDMELFLSINSSEDFAAHQEQIDEIIAQLRVLKNEDGATYIYALKEIDGTYYFIFDTDEEAGTPDNPVFTEYELAPVHEEAFAGDIAAGIMNVEDEWGSYNTGAIPLLYEHRQVGIISVDFEDTFIERSRQTAAFGVGLLIITMSLTMAVFLWFLIILLRRNQKMQNDLFYVANHDGITKLYNRYYLFSYLSKWNKLPHSKTATFALLFIDLDNFKNVNDSAGHDEGDKLLRLISQFLRAYTDKLGDTGCIESITARIGGDEFLQIVPDIATAEGAERWARVLLADFAADPELAPYAQKYGVGLSIGGALYPSLTTDYDELIRLADIAMYHAKAGGKNNYSLYDESMGDGPDDIILSVRTRKR
jgi:diguanylate cyclase (GGDEF)-like protein